MEHDFEKLPAEIFDWIETQHFSQLNPEQKKTVLRFFSPSEYAELHQTAGELRSVPVSAPLENNQALKQMALARFDKVYSAKKVIPFNSRGMLAWQAAAILLLLLSGYLFYQVFDLKNDLVLQQVVSVDTVYVDREVQSDPEIVHDTVYRYATEKKENVSRQPDLITSGKLPQASAGMVEAGVMPSDEAELSKEHKGSSMRDDSLLKHFGFYSL